jgi:hypothetical protein
MFVYCALLFVCWMCISIYSICVSFRLSIPYDTAENDKEMACWHSQRKTNNRSHQMHNHEELEIFHRTNKQPWQVPADNNTRRATHHSVYIYIYIIYICVCVDLSGCAQLYFILSVTTKNQKAAKQPTTTATRGGAKYSPYV